MSLNIKNPRVHALAREAAERTGLSQTSVIEQALERLLDDLGRAGRADRESRIARILADVDASLSDDDRAALLSDDLYDDAGLPA
ncbi:type II toxin-antitoxin system VapB family antitoxin [Cellulomonas sp. JH27-2]|uniref:type II toxin-antitoxin system VapB family antitoxin n=1 Tax=Cellulomonas sp. JH27-2 TaxID=2774139 RepID=UPI00177FCBC7|nr:type II toxin-antitoxin system VapB family antitoxin [Cellulomonas sp. JH27-2]MBD8058146.1 type II toxin-antitoxin system VapB family antitoxin [Cellulomonas sp. JH27-2]